MGVYLPNMEMPTNTDMAPTAVWVYPNGYAVVFKDNGKMKQYTQAVPVPPHGRLGDLDRLAQMFVDIDNAPYSGFDGSEPFYSAEDAAQIIRLSPTIISAVEGET